MFLPILKMDESSARSRSEIGAGKLRTADTILSAVVYCITNVILPGIVQHAAPQEERMDRFMSRPVVGILTYRKGMRFNEPGYFRDLVREGGKLGATVFIFSHTDIRPESRTVRGFVPSPGGGWQEQSFPWPDIVIDRCRKWAKGFKEMRSKNYFPYANHKFTQKWKATQLFANSEATSKWVPKTKIYTPDTLLQMVRQYPIVYVKPGNGTGGFSVVKIARSGGGFKLTGRRGKGLTLAHAGSERELVRWFERWVVNQRIRKGNFLVQQGLDLELIPGRVVDNRLFIQKNGEGKWGVTGIGMRVGGKNSPTSNLIWKGGKALHFDEFMKKRFGEEKAKHIRKESEALAHGIVQTIEANFGSMFEFGLDVGVDKKGDVWLIEVNPKPCRSVFQKMGDRKTYLQTVQRPIEYAMYLARKQKKHAD